MIPVNMWLIGLWRGLFFADQLNITPQVALYNAHQPNLIHHTIIVINSVRNGFSVRLARAIPVDVGISRLKNQLAPAVVDVNVNTLHKLVGEWTEQVV